MTLGNGEWDRVEKKIRATVLKVTGKPPSGGAGVCCAGMMDRGTAACWCLWG